MENQDLRDGQDLLISMEDITTPSRNFSVEKDDKNRKLEFRYKDDMQFDKPVVIRGMKKFLVPHENLMDFSYYEDRCSVNELVEMCRNLDSFLKLITVENISDIKISFVEEDSYMFLDCSDCNLGFGDPAYFVVPTYQKVNGKCGPAFRKWSELLKVPYTYSKKNPGFLNETNFIYWKKILTEVKEAPVPMDFVYVDKLIKINHPDEGLIQAYVVINFLKSKVEKVSKEEFSILHSKLEDRVPLINKIIEQVNDSISGNFPELVIKVQQYSLGYSGTNKGRHFVRLLVDGVENSIEVDGDLMFPDIVIDTDFIGRDSDFENVNISFGLFREACSNGTIINWNGVQKEQIMIKYVDNYLLRMGVSPEMDSYTRVKSEAESNFNFLFSAQGITIPVKVANSSFSKDIFSNILRFFLDTLLEIKENFEELTTPLIDIEEKKFVSVVFSLAKSMHLPSDLVKMMVFEYIVGNFEMQEQIFKSPWDILNFMTFISKIYNTKVQLEVQKKAYMFAYYLMEILINNRKKDTLIFDHYSRQINREGL